MKNFDLEKYLKDLEYLVNIDSGSRYLPGLNKIVDYFTKEFEELGFAVKKHDLEEVGPMLEIRNFPEVKEVDALFVGHIDTVFPLGSIDDWRFSRDGTKIYGPGVEDMKSGVLAMREIVKNIDKETLENVKICILMNPDEEISSYKSKEIIKDIAKDTKFGFIMESAGENGELVNKRKGLAKFELEFFGRSAHAGVAPQDGRDANLELARFMIALDKLEDVPSGLTVNMGFMQGGTVPNVVSNYAKGALDIRYEKLEQIDSIRAEFERLKKDALNRDIKVEIKVLGERPPMMPTKKTYKLMEFYDAIAREKNIDLKWTATGGGSDGNFLAFEGVTTIDGLGGFGGGNHSRREYLNIDSIEERIDLMVSLIDKMYKEKMF